MATSDPSGANQRTWRVTRARTWRRGVGYLILPRRCRRGVSKVRRIYLTLIRSIWPFALARSAVALSAAALAVASFSLADLAASWAAASCFWADSMSAVALAIASWAALAFCSA